MSWHYEEGPPRPHLITSLAVRQGIDEALRAEYMIALWLLTLVGLAIDRETTNRGRIGVVLDNAIELDVDELQEFDFKRGLDLTRSGGQFPAWAQAASFDVESRRLSNSSGA